MKYQTDPEVYKKIESNGFKCLCQIDTPCPCPLAKKHCKCGLFVRVVKNKISEDEKKLVIARLKQLSDNIIISIG